MSDNYYSAPNSVDFILTLKCNLKCTHCNLNGGDPMSLEMTTDEVVDCINQLYDIGVMEIAFSGGEILCRKDWKEIITYTAELAQWPIIINTNGLLWKKADLLFIKQFPHVRLAISSDGFSAETYSLLRKLPSGLPAQQQFIDVTKMIQLTLALELKFNINIMITEKTLDFFFQTIDYYAKLGVKDFLGIKFFPGGRGFGSKEELEIEYPTWSSFLENVIDYKIHNPEIHLGILIPCPWELYLPLLERGYTVNDVYQFFNYKTPLLNPYYRQMRDLGCHGGISTCTIFPDGTVFPCSIVSSNLEAFNCGTLREKSFEEIWEKSEVLGILRKLNLNDLDGPCSKCKYRQLCGGGCRARALILKQKITAADPNCPIVIKEALKMKVFEIETNGHLLRIRKERFGCAIFSGNTQIDGNEITFQVLQILFEVKDINKLIERLAKEFQVDRAELIADLKDLFAVFQPLGWFIDEFHLLANEKVGV